MAELILNAEVRNKVGKEDAKKLRVKELIPTVVYGKDVTPLHCAISKLQIDKLLRKVNRNSLITLKLSNNESKLVIVRDHQKHPISHEYVHLDLQAVDMKHPIKVDVDLEFVGTPIGKKSGGVFNSMCKQVKIECLPGKIPDVIKLNIDNLDAGQSLHVSDIAAGDFKILTNSKIALCQISQIKDETPEGTTATPAEGAAAAPAAASAAKAAAPAAAAAKAPAAKAAAPAAKKAK
ncbi:MAG: 50S ribosomal protein L25 [Candidatus Riflebacteria bacterium HGW-Riflebacteria-1]|jgi:large subunit ribosomal protein L25|nr:MAG: 50S ribosomal protein L25 [Candidatus Riflebacteria bacterium HGW-Riflebacteria-1]